MKNILRKILLVIAAFTFVFMFDGNAKAYDVQEQKNILVLQSYNEDMDWTRDLSEGIIEKVRQKNENIFLSFEYMDWKNYPTKDNLDYLYEYYKFKYTDKKLDVIIVCDDIAFSFALKYREELFPDVPIVFCGVNQESLSKIDSQYKNYTGVLEVADPTETVKMAYSINPSLEKIYLVYDNTESGISTAKLFREKIESMDQDFDIVPLNTLKFNELLDELRKLEENSIVLYATYNSDAVGTVIEYNIALREMCKNSNVPVYHQYEFGLMNGAFGGNLISPAAYGKCAAEMALQIIDGTQADNIKIFSPDVANKVVDFNQLERFGIALGDIPEDVKVVNKPFSFLETYKTLVIIVSLIMVFLTLLILVLFVYTNKVRKIKGKLAVKNTELTEIYNELVSSDEELKKQYAEICSMQEDLCKSEEKYTYLAMHDVLTGLPNRRSLFEDESRYLMQNQNKYAALLFLDLDNFKYINDTMSHEFGDEFIKKVSERLSMCLTTNSILYRLGGDEFIILLYNMNEQSEIEQFADKLISNLKKKFFILNSKLKASASIGIAVYPDHGVTVDELIKAADIAMYKSKEEGKNRYTIYEEKMNADFSERVILEKHFHSAIENNEFEVNYQPQVSANTGRVTGLEALLRWNNVELGTVSPLKFIEIAEVSRTIVTLGEWILRQACAFLCELHKKGYSDLTISVNISVIQILQTDFTDKVIEILEKYELVPRYLELEVTETVMVESMEVILGKLQTLDDLGIRIALDDFGKGYSSLNYLMQLPISTLKIDKSFVDNISVEEEYNGIINHIINMGKSLGMTIVAEGVETTEQLEYLKKYNCNKIQGFLFSKPLGMEEVITYIEKNY